MSVFTVERLLQAGEERLRAAGVDSPEYDARLLAREALHLGPAELLFARRQAVPESLAAGYLELVARRAAREPLQYLLGSTEFYGRRFFCDERALIPRPETEILAEQAVLAAAGLPAGAVVVDVGTGTGCLAVTLAALHPQLEVWATDVSAEALRLARENVAYHRVEDRVVLAQGTGLQPLREAGRSEGVALVVSNPPYVRREELATLQPEVRDWEPALALDGGPDGLEFYRELLAECAGLSSLQHLLLETGYDQAASVAGLVREALGEGLTDIRADLGGIPRVVHFRRGARAAREQGRLAEVGAKI